MPGLTRRTFMLLGATAGAYGALGRLPRARAADSSPHFLISIHVQPGMDCTYLFDGRLPKLTEKNLQQNYLFRNDSGAGSPTQPGEFTDDKLRQRTVSCDLTGSTALRSPLVDALWAAHQDRLSIVNGVYMLRTNAGHAENSAYLLGNTASGGAPIYPPLVGQRLGGTPLESVLLRDLLQISPPPSNLAGSAELSLDDVSALATTLSGGPQIDEQSPSWGHILARADANGQGDGLFGAGSQDLARALRRAKATGAALAATGSDPGNGQAATLDEAVRRALSFFQNGLTKVVTLVHTENVDTHDRITSQTTQVPTYTSIAAQIGACIDLLKTTMFVGGGGSSVPFIDVTTFVISSEFGRTTRSLAFPSGSTVGATGTDHNPLNNSALVGGKGIVGGLIVGESDLRDCDDDGNYLDVSGAHRQMNHTLDQVMGKPFDFTTQRVRSDLPNAWSETDYIIMPSVTNTILDAFGVPPGSQFKLGPRVAPLLSVLRTGVRS